MKVKIFFENNAYALEEQINKFLSNNNLYVIKIDYIPTSRQMSTSHAAMIQYEEEYDD